MASPMTFRVRRQNPELVAPAKPTPHELRPVSDLDDQNALRFHFAVIQFYHNNSLKATEDPIKVIRDAIAQALVFYYPLAGRLRECGPRKKLVVDCTAEGVMFIGADADATLHQFGDILRPPFPNIDDLIYDVPSSRGIINCPLLLIQVTRLKCGGFIVALRLNHTMCDVHGLHQFLTAVGEFARGAQAPSIPPVWDRHLLSARYPPCVPFKHSEYALTSDSATTPVLPKDLVERSFLFDATDISALRQTLPPHSRRCTKFELVTACVWRCRTLAISPNPNEEVQFSILVNIRKRLNPPLPQGYYGNVIVLPAAVTQAEKLIKNSLHYAVELVRKLKSEATEAYMKSVMDLMAVESPNFALTRSYIASDLTHSGLEEVDYGWGKAVYGGPATVGIDPAPGLVSLVTIGTEHALHPNPALV